MTVRVLVHQFLVAGVLVEDAGQRGLEAGEVRAAAGGVDVVGEAEDLLVVAVVVLEGHFHDDALRPRRGR